MKAILKLGVLSGCVDIDFPDDEIFMGIIENYHDYLVKPEGRPINSLVALKFQRSTELTEGVYEYTFKCIVNRS